MKPAHLLSTSKPDVAASSRVVMYTGIPKVADTPGMTTQKCSQHGQWYHAGYIHIYIRHSKTHLFEHSEVNYLTLSDMVHLVAYSPLQIALKGTINILVSST